MIQQYAGSPGMQSTGSTNPTRPQLPTESTDDRVHALIIYIVKFPQDVICLDLETYQYLCEDLKSESKTTEEEASAALETSPAERFLFFKDGQNPHRLTTLANVKRIFQKSRPQSKKTLSVPENIFTKLFTELFPHALACNYHLVGFLHTQHAGSHDLESWLNEEHMIYIQSLNQQSASATDSVTS
jgi:hypothetical protein